MMSDTTGIMKTMTHTVIGMIAVITIIVITIAMNMIVMITMDVGGNSLPQLLSMKKAGCSRLFYD
jgi:hypothetical protein